MSVATLYLIVLSPALMGFACLLLQPRCARAIQRAHQLMRMGIVNESYLRYARAIHGNVFQRWYYRKLLAR